MPRGDGSGPRGMGPMTGRAAGYCAGYNRPGFASLGCGFGARGGFGPGGGRGMGFGARGMGYGRGYGVWNRPSAEQEQELLKSQLAELEGLSAELKQRLADLEERKSE